MLAVSLQFCLQQVQELTAKVHTGLLTRSLSHSSSGQMAFWWDDEQPGSAVMALMVGRVFFLGFPATSCAGASGLEVLPQQQQQEGGQQAALCWGVGGKTPMCSAAAGLCGARLGVLYWVSREWQAKGVLRCCMNAAAGYSMMRATARSRVLKIVGQPCCNPASISTQWLLFVGKVVLWACRGANRDTSVVLCGPYRCVCRFAVVCGVVPT